jgi:hypothetical protein
VIDLQETAVDARKKLKELRTERNRLFERFLKNPSDIGLAIEIKKIDNQVAELVGRRKRIIPT